MSLAGLASRFISKETLRRFALWALQLLEEQLDTEAKPRLEKYRKDRAALEAQTQTVFGEIATREAQLKFLLVQRSAAEQRLAKNEEQLKQLKQEVIHNDDQTNEVDSLSDDDVLHADVRRHRG